MPTGSNGISPPFKKNPGLAAGDVGSIKEAAYPVENDNDSIKIPFIALHQRGHPKREICPSPRVLCREVDFVEEKQSSASVHTMQKIT